MSADTKKTVNTLSDADITSSAAVNRRSMISSVGRGLGLAALAAGAVAASSTTAHAGSDRANTYDNDSNDRRPSTDND
jgi:hypothetical protein